MLLFIFIITSCEKIIVVPDLKDEIWSFIVFSDVQQGYGVFSKLSENIGDLEPAPLAAFCCGDIMSRSANEAEWSSFMNTATPIRQKMPLLIARGNHEQNDSLSEACLRQFGLISSDHFYYTHIEGNVFFILLDTFERGKEGSIAGEQFSWLQQQLDSASAASSILHIFIFMHQPLYPQGKHKGEDLSNADELHRLFLEHKKIRAIFSGHDHMFNEYIKDGIVYLTTGGGGGQLFHGCGGDYHHFLKVSFLKDTSLINIKTIDIFNETIDSFNL